jgi:hypothetical protein
MNGFYTGEIDDELFLDVAVVKRAGHNAHHQLSLKGSQPRTPFHVVFGSRYWVNMLKPLIIITMLK